MLNVVALQGRLVRDPEMRQTMSGKQVASFTLACDRGHKDANGKTTADFINIVAWEQRAEFAYRYFAKGQLVAVDGRLQSRTYQAKDGTNRTAVEVVANNLHFCGGKNEGGSQQAASAMTAQPAVGTPAPQYNAAPGDDFALLEDEGDLPF